MTSNPNMAGTDFLGIALDALVAEALDRSERGEMPTQMRSFMKFGPEGYVSDGADEKRYAKLLVLRCIEEGSVPPRVLAAAVEEIAKAVGGRWQAELERREPEGYGWSFAWQALAGIAAEILDACCAGVDYDLAKAAGLARFERFRGAEEVVWCQRVAMNGVKVVNGPHQLSDDISIHPADDRFKEALWAAHGPAGPFREGKKNFTEGQRMLVKILDAVVETRRPSSRTGGADTPGLHVESSRAITALRAQGARRISALVTWLTPPPDSADLDLNLTSSMWMGPGEWTPRVTPLVVDEAVAARIREWLKARGEGSGNTSLDFAIQRLNLSDERESNEDRVVDAWIAFEALLTKPSGEGGELSYRIPLRLAMLLGDSSRERKEIRKLARHSYALRSKIVHGALPGARAKKFDVDQVAEATERLLREVLQKWVVSGYGNPQEVIEMLEDALLEGQTD